MRQQFNCPDSSVGRAEDQADHVGSIPITRSFIKKNVMHSSFFMFKHKNNKSTGSI